MTHLTILPYREAQTHNPTECSIEHQCIKHFAESVGIHADTFDGSESVTYYDASGAFVAAMLYDAGENKPFKEASYFVQEIIVNVCGHRKLSEIMKDLCMYVTSVDDSFGDFNFVCGEEDSLTLLLQEFCVMSSYDAQDKATYFSYTV